MIDTGEGVIYEKRSGHEDSYPLNTLSRSKTSASIGFIPFSEAKSPARSASAVSLPLRRASALIFVRMLRVRETGLPVRKLRQSYVLRVFRASLAVRMTA